jgi:hypothetical protein
VGRGSSVTRAIVTAHGRKGEGDRCRFGRMTYTGSPCHCPAANRTKRVTTPNSSRFSPETCSARIIAYGYGRWH